MVWCCVLVTCCNNWPSSFTHLTILPSLRGCALTAISVHKNTVNPCPWRKGSTTYPYARSFSGHQPRLEVAFRRLQLMSFSPNQAKQSWFRSHGGKIVSAAVLVESGDDLVEAMRKCKALPILLSAAGRGCRSMPVSEVFADTITSLWRRQR